MLFVGQILFVEKVVMVVKVSQGDLHYRLAFFEESRILEGSPLKLLCDMGWSGREVHGAAMMRENKPNKICQAWATLTKICYFGVYRRIAISEECVNNPVSFKSKQYQWFKWLSVGLHFESLTETRWLSFSAQQLISKYGSASRKVKPKSKLTYIRWPLS